MVDGLGTRARIEHNAKVRAVLKDLEVPATVKSGRQDTRLTVVFGFERSQTKKLMEALTVMRGVAGVMRKVVEGLETIHITWEK
jgi:hypothetical protein